jgi:Tfp pilus assembly protein PilF
MIPYNLTFDNSFPQLPFMQLYDWQFILSALVLIAIVVVAFLSLKSKSLLGFGLWFFLITFSISCNLFVTIGTHYGERLFYTPLLGCMIAFVALLQVWMKKQNVDNSTSIQFNSPFVYAPIVVAGIFAILTVARNPVWANNGTLYESGLTSAPNSARVQFYMGNYLIKEDQLKDKTPAQQDEILNRGISYLKQSLKLAPTFTDAWNQLGIANLRLKKFDESASAFETALKNNPTDPTVYNNLGTVYFNTKKYDQAFSNFQKAVQLNPRYVDALVNLGSIYGTFGKYQEAINSYNLAINYDPNNAQAYFFIAITYQNQGNTLLANQNFEKAYALNPSLRK